jgi:hypothetical protein
VRRTAVAALCLAAFRPGPARADSPRVDASVALGYAAPVGGLERLSRVADTTFGIVPLDVAVAYMVREPLAVVMTGSAALGIPKLCASAGDCVASLSHDYSMALGVRYSMPHVGSAAPFARVGMGYEVYASSLADQGSNATRAYAGPVLLDAELALRWSLSPHVSWGPYLRGRLGTFTNGSVETPSFHTDAVDGRSLHGWLGGGMAFAYAL